MGLPDAGYWLIYKELETQGLSDCETEGLSAFATALSASRQIIRTRRAIALSAHEV